MNRFIYISLLSFLPLVIIEGQATDKQRVIQVTGIINDEDSVPVPGVSVISHMLRRGTISEYSGIYNVLSVPGDTIWYSALGYKSYLFIVPSAVEKPWLHPYFQGKQDDECIENRKQAHLHTGQQPYQEWWNDRQGRSNHGYQVCQRASQRQERWIWGSEQPVANAEEQPGQETFA